jgi:peptidoglycan/LPS O-acetylase OafA/YrhL
MLLSFLRIFAVLAVYFHHQPISFLQFKSFDFQRELHFGVSIFFVLSGFLLAKYAEEPDFYTVQKLKRYFSRRLLRVFPAYLFALCWTLILLNEKNSAKIFLNIFLLQGFFDDYRLWLIQSTWSLTTEMCFYLLFPFLSLFWRSAGAYSIAAILLISLISNIVGGEFYSLIFFTGRLPDFFVGMIFYFERKKISTFIQGERRKKGVFILSLILFAGFFLFNVFSENGVKDFYNRLIYSCLQPFLISFIILQLYFEDIKKASPRVHFFAAASYPFFLIHSGKIQEFLWQLMPNRFANFLLLVLLSLFIEGFILFLQKKIKKINKT